MFQITMIMEDNKIIKEEISVNPAKRNFYYFFITLMSLHKRTAERRRRHKVRVRQIWQRYYLRILLSVILLLNITVFLDFESTGNKLLLFTIQIEVLVVLQINMVKLSVNKTKWPGLSVRTRAFILQILI